MTASFAGFPFAIVLGIAIAIGPFLLVMAFTTKGRGVLWKAFLIGWAGWVLALLARLVPLQIPPLFLASQLAASIPLSLLIGVYASLLAGVFEEGFRFLILSRRSSLRINRRSVLAFGLGWGLGEAVIVYALPILRFLAMGEIPSLIDIIPGALERNLAIVAHVSLTFIVLSALERGRTYLVLAMYLHFALDVIAVATVLLTQNIWLTEGMIALVVVILVMIAFRLRPSREQQRDSSGHDYSQGWFESTDAPRLSPR